MKSNKYAYIKKPQLNITELSKAEISLWSHYKYLYPTEYELFYTKRYNYYYKENKYKFSDAAKLAKRDTIEYLTNLDDPIQAANNVWQCPICGRRIIDMGAHVEKVHEILWDDFIDKYQWQGKRIFTTDNHRKNLSINKLHYYNETEAGAERRKKQSIQNSGANNPACREDVKLKIAKKMRGRSQTIKNKAAVSKNTTGGLYSENARSFGYTFWAIVDGVEYRFRSKVEYMIFLMLSYYNISFEYEPFKIAYYDPAQDYMRHYMVDFKVNDRLFEVKPNIHDYKLGEDKYKLVNAQLLKQNKKLEILFPYNFYELFNIDESLEKPLTFFNDLIIKNIKEGNCKVKLPVTYKIENDYCKKHFLRKLGENPTEIIKTGELIYENKKRENRIK